MRKDHDPPTDESALSRWSRRKAAAAESPAAETAEPAPMAHTGLPTAPPPGAPIEESAEKVLTDADMPPLDSLTEESDFSAFLSPGVSDGLRKLALRKLFQGAGFNIRDGLDDYDDDFTSFEGLGDLITADMKHQEEMRELRRREAEAEAERLAETEEPVAGEDAETEEEEVSATPAEDSSQDSTAATGSSDSATDPEDPDREDQA